MTGPAGDHQMLCDWLSIVGYYRRFRDRQTAIAPHIAIDIIIVINFIILRVNTVGNGARTNGNGGRRRKRRLRRDANGEPVSGARRNSLQGKGDHEHD